MNGGWQLPEIDLAKILSGTLQERRAAARTALVSNGSSFAVFLVAGQFLPAFKSFGLTFALGATCVATATGFLAPGMYRRTNPRAHSEIRKRLGSAN